MDCMAEYKDKEGNKKSFYWDSKDYGSKKDCLQAMEKEEINTNEIEIIAIWSSD